MFGGYLQYVWRVHVAYLEGIHRLFHGVPVTCSAGPFIVFPVVRAVRGCSRRVSGVSVPRLLDCKEPLWYPQ